MPDFIKPEAFGVNEPLLAQLATASCLNEITLDWHRGMTSQAQDVGFGGFAAPGAAFAVASSKATESPLGKYSFTSPPSESISDMLCGHTTRDVRVSVDVPEVQDRLSQIGKIRSLPHWATWLDKAVGGQIRAASSEHLMRSPNSVWEAVGGAATFNAALISELFNTDIKGAPLGTLAGVVLNTVIMTVGVHNAVKFAIETKYALKREGRGFDDVCFSVFPGFHIDRYLGVAALTRARRIIRPMPTQ